MKIIFVFVIFLYKFFLMFILGCEVSRGVGCLMLHTYVFGVFFSINLKKKDSDLHYTVFKLFSWDLFVFY